MASGRYFMRHGKWSSGIKSEKGLFHFKNVFSVVRIVDICYNRYHLCQLWKMPPY